jgi:hypothetical protein
MTEGSGFQENTVPDRVNRLQFQSTRRGPRGPATGLACRPSPPSARTGASYFLGESETGGSRKDPPGWVVVRPASEVKL